MSHLDYPNAARLDARVRLHEECSTNRYGWHRWVMDHVSVYLIGSVLEIGTGPAYLWDENLDRIPADIHLVLGDRSLGMLVDARQKLQQSAVQNDWVECDVGRLPFPTAYFNLVIANHLLFLLEDPAGAVAELARTLAPGRMMCCTTNHRDHLQDLITWLAELSPMHFGHLLSGEAQMRRERFNFVSGADLLMPYFDDIRLVTYPDGLEIENVEILEPWIDYWAKPVMSAQERKQILSALSAYIAQEGVLQVRKNSGMFIARKSE